jgi:hypothetical protein
MILTCLPWIIGLGKQEKGANMSRDVVAEIRRADRRKLRADE